MESPVPAPPRRFLARFAAFLAALLGGVSVLALGSGAALPAPNHDRIVRTWPASTSPRILDGRVLAIAEVGDRIVAGGTFTQVANPGSDVAMTRPYLVAFHRTTGVIDTAFAPDLDDEVRALLPGPTGTVYVGGKFDTVNGAAGKAITQLQMSNGQKVAAFNPFYINGIVQAIELAHGELLIGGTFTTIGQQARGGLASLDPVTGAWDNYLTVDLTEHHNYNGTGAQAPIGTENFALGAGGTRLMVIGNFRKADGLDRDQAVMLDLSPTGAAIANWQTNGFTARCASGAFDSWVRDIAVSPDGSYFVVVSTGAGFTGTLCDTANRWEATAVGADLKPTWVLYCGGDSLYSVAITEQAVYIGGHIRWVNDLARDNIGPGAMGRASLAALDPRSGMPFSWNPGRNPRGFGITELLATSAGLWLGHDTDYVGNSQYYRPRVTFFPLAGGIPVPADTVTGLPGNVYLAGPLAGGNTMLSRTYDGASGVGPDTPVANPDGTAWGNARGAFRVGGRLYYGMSDGNLYSRTFDGAAFGAPSLVDPYHDNDGVLPDWDTVSDGRGHTYTGAFPNFYGSELAAVTGMFYAGARIYYTLSNSGSLFWRWFNPENGAIGAERFTAASTGFTATQGVFTANGLLYFSRTADGRLYRMDFAGGVPSGTPVAVSGIGIDGFDWRARALFLAP